jgi:bacillithiol system protein YtxJ
MIFAGIASLKGLVKQLSGVKAPFVELFTTAALDAAFAESGGAPVVLFKHSNSCPISAYAYGQMSGLQKKVLLVVVQKARDISNEIAARTGVRHESPQVLILKNGSAVFQSSHYDITTEDVEKAVRETYEDKIF